MSHKEAEANRCSGGLGWVQNFPGSVGNFSEAESVLENSVWKVWEAL